MILYRKKCLKSLIAVEENLHEANKYSLSKTFLINYFIKLFFFNRKKKTLVSNSTHCNNKQFWGKVCYIMCNFTCLTNT